MCYIGSNIIIKPKIGDGGINIKIINYEKYKTIEKDNNYVYMEYINHKRYYVGHFLVRNGKIIKKIYFAKDNNIDLFIQKGKLCDYEILNEIIIDYNKIDDSIFHIYN